MKMPNFEKIERVSIMIIAGISVIGGLIFGFINAEIKNFSGVHNLKSFQPSMPSRIYDVNGDVIAELFLDKRDLVAFEDLPPSLIHAFLAAEDGGFYDHFGIDTSAIIRAMGKNVLASVKHLRPTIVQGGSTITQQLAKRLFTSGERTFARKALEAILALQIEKRFTKDEILEMYFNQIYLGHGCHGIATAGKFFFNKKVKYLTVAESSVLAGLPSKPTGYSPIKYPRRACRKHREILSRMVDAGYLTEKHAGKVYEEFWPSFIDSIITQYPTKTAKTKTLDYAPYFTDYVRQALVGRFGKDVVYDDGLSVYTTLNLKHQLIAEKLLREGVKEQDRISQKANAYYNSGVDRGLFGSYGTLRMIFPLPGLLIRNDIETQFKKEMVDELIESMDIITLLGGEPNSNRAIDKFRFAIAGISTNLHVEGAFIAIEPQTGYITTMVGGSKFKVSNQYNRAVQARRQPGSSFKPFVYGAGIDAKIVTTKTVIPDAPILDVDSSGETWEPDNYEGGYRGMVPLDYALPCSINIVSIRLFDLIGPDKIIDFAAKMTKAPVTRFTTSPTLALGTSELTPLEMATGFAIYANSGRDVIPYAVRYVVDRDGHELANIEGEVGTILARKAMDGSLQIIPESTAWIMTQLMRLVVDQGTAADGIRNQAGFSLPAGGKTGTTSNWSDVWFCGFTPNLSAVVWMGYDRPFMSLGKHQAAAVITAPMWGKYMREIYNGMPIPRFPEMPKDVELIGGGYGRTGSKSQYFESSDGGKMKTVLERYMEVEGLVNDDKQ